MSTWWCLVFNCFSGVSSGGVSPQTSDFNLMQMQISRQRDSTSHVNIPWNMGKKCIAVWLDAEKGIYKKVCLISFKNNWRWSLNKKKYTDKIRPDSCLQCSFEVSAPSSKKKKNILQTTWWAYSIMHCSKFNYPTVFKVVKLSSTINIWSNKMTHMLQLVMDTETRRWLKEFIISALVEDGGNRLSLGLRQV